MTLARIFWERLLEIQKQSKPDLVQVLGSPKKEVNRFLGWAIFKMLNDLTEKQEKDWAKGDDETEWDDQVTFLREMRILHSQAILMPDYMENCYEPLDVMTNLGGLTLVAPEFFEFGKVLVKAAAEALSQDKLRKEGNKSMEVAREKVDDNKEIRRIFLECSKDSPLEEKVKLDLLDKLVTKVFNARFGAELKLFKDHETGRRGDKKSDQSLRGELKSK